MTAKGFRKKWEVIDLGQEPDADTLGEIESLGVEGLDVDFVMPTDVVAELADDSVASRPRTLRPEVTRLVMDPEGQRWTVPEI